MYTKAVKELLKEKFWKVQKLLASLKTKQYCTEAANNRSYDHTDTCKALLDDGQGREHRKNWLIPMEKVRSVVPTTKHNKTESLERLQPNVKPQRLLT